MYNYVIYMCVYIYIYTVYICMYVHMYIYMYTHIVHSRTSPSSNFFFARRETARMVENIFFLPIELAIRNSRVCLIT